jgi:hypothetical protein
VLLSTILLAANPSDAVETGTASFTIRHIEITGGTLVIDDLPFAIGDLVTATYSFDETFEPTPVPGTVSGLDYSGAFSAFSASVEAAVDTSVDFEQGVSAITASTFDDEPAESGAYDLLSVFGFGPTSVSGPGFPDGDELVSAIASFVNTGSLDLVVGGAPPVGTFSNFDFAEVAFSLESGAVVRVLNVAPVSPVPALSRGMLGVLAVLVGLIGVTFVAPRWASVPLS